MKKIIGLLLCAGMLFSEAFLCVALTLDSAEAGAYVSGQAELLSDNNVLTPISASGFDGKNKDVNPSYPGAYYTFDKKINTETLTLENIQNSEVCAFEYIEDTNTVVLFKDTESLLYGETVRFDEWLSDVESIDGEKLLFPSLSYTIDDAFCDIGSNLIPYGDFEKGFSPVFYADASETFSGYIAEEADGNHVFYMDASEYSGALYPHAQAGFVFEAGSTYKFIYRIKHAGMSLDANGNTVANKNTNAVASALFTGSQTGATTNRLVKHQHSFPNVKITFGNDWITKENIITINETTKEYYPEGFSVYTNPQSKSTVSFMLDDIAVYKRCDIIYLPGDDCVLKAGCENPAKTEGVFLDGSGETTISVPVFEMPYESKNEDYYMDEEKPWKDEYGNTYGFGDIVDVSEYNKNVILTPNLKTDVQYYTVSFDMNGLKSAPSDFRVKSGTVIDLSSYYSVSLLDTSMNFNGWSEQPSNSLWDAVYEITVDGDITLYPIISYDFNFAIPSNRQGWTCMNCNVASYNQQSMLVTQTGGNVDVILKRNVSIPADLFSGATAYFEEECFNNELLDNIFFNRAGEGDNHARSLGAVLGETVNGYQTVNYNAQNNQNWTGTITTLRYDPFQAKGKTAVRALVFNYNPEVTVTDIEISGITTPVSGDFDNTKADFKELTGVSYFESVSWKPELINGKFTKNTVYTANVVLKPNKGSVFSAETPYTIHFGDKSSEAVFEEHKLWASFTFDETESFIEFKAEIDGPDKISKEGRSVQYSFVTDTDIPDKTAVWSVDNEELAKITENGRLIPSMNGTVTIKAVSNYDSSVYAEKTVIIENQSEYVNIIYNSGTTDEVYDMPENGTGKGNVTLSDATPQREGYIFLGWSLEDGSSQTVSTVNAASDDVYVYAVWGKGVMWDFTDSNPYISSIASGSMRTDGKNLVCTTSASQTDLRLQTINPELDPSKYDKIVVRMAVNTSDKVQIFYKSEYLDTVSGSIKTVGYNINKDGSSGYGYAAALSNSVLYEGKGLDEYITVILPMSKTGDVGTWGNESTKKIVGLWIDPFDANSKECRIDYIAFIEKEETVKPANSGTSSGSSTPKEYNMNVTDVVNTNPAFVPDKNEEDDTAATDKEASFCSPFEASKSEGTVIFNFNEEQSNVLFEKMHRMSLYSASESVLGYDCLGYKTKYSYTNPYLETTTLELDAKTHPYVVVKAKITGILKKELTLSFKEKGSIFTSAKSVTKPLDFDYSMIVYDMSCLDGWTDKIEKIRFSVDGSSAGRLYIDWIMFTDTLPESMDEIPGTSERFPAVNNEAFPFADVKEEAWFRKEVEQAYRIGLVKGVSENAYNPSGNITVAEAIAFAVRLNGAFPGDSHSEASTDEKLWYQPYVDAAIEKGIIKDGQFADYNVFAKRKEVAAIMAKSVPASELQTINMFKSLPDISTKDSCYGGVIKLYRAGVLMGSDESYSFLPETLITRAEVAAIINRIALPVERKRIVTHWEIESLKIKLWSDDIVSDAVLYGCTREVFTEDGARTVAVSDTSDPSVMLTRLFTEPDENGNPVMMNGADITAIRIGFKWDEAACENPVESGCKLYYTTLKGGWSDARSIIPLWDGKKDASGVAELVFNTSDNVQFANELTGVRFDPFDCPGKFEITYIIIE